MGAWIADYFDDAGYKDWEKTAPLYKAMLMNAFPPVTDLNGIKPDFGTMPIDQFENTLMKFLSMIGDHLAIERRRNISTKNNRLISTLMQRR